MKHLRKFEELEHSTYISAADKISSYGQTDRAAEIRSHANKMARMIIDNMTFGILVGSVRTFPSAKFDNGRIFKSGNAYTLQVIFKSDDNTHIVTSKVTNDGEITWTDGNKFMNRGSAIKFQQLVQQLGKFQSDFVSFLNEYDLKTDDFKVVLRTFYN
jgi:hypothetical protein